MHGARNCAGWDWKPEKYRRPGSVVYAFNIHQDNREEPRWRFLESSTYHNNHPYLREPGETGLWNSSVIRGVSYGEDYSFRNIMISAKFLRSVQTFHHVMLSLRKQKTAALPSSSLLLCLCFAVVIRV